MLQIRSVLSIAVMLNLSGLDTAVLLFLFLSNFVKMCVKDQT